MKTFLAVLMVITGLRASEIVEKRGLLPSNFQSPPSPIYSPGKLSENNGAPGWPPSGAFLPPKSQNPAPFHQAPASGYLQPTRLVTKVIRIPVPEPVPVTHTVRIPVPYEVSQPVPVPVHHPIPVYINKPYPVKVDQPVEIYLPRPLPIQIPEPASAGHRDSLDGNGGLLATSFGQHYGHSILDFTSQNTGYSYETPSRQWSD